MELPKLNLKFNAPPVLFNQIIDRRDEVVTLTEYQKMLWDKRCKTDRTEHRLSMFSNPIIHSDDVAPTLTSGAGVNALYDLPRSLNKKELCEIGSYPVDYDFGNVKPEYLIGMSVPPAMIANIAYQIAMQCFNI